jgi:hypothetical protein
MAKRKQSRHANLNTQCSHAVPQPSRKLATGIDEAKARSNARVFCHVVRQQCHEGHDRNPAQWGSVARSAPIEFGGYRFAGDHMPWKASPKSPQAHRSRVASKWRWPSARALRHARRSDSGRCAIYQWSIHAPVLEYRGHCRSWHDPVTQRMRTRAYTTVCAMTDSIIEQTQSPNK